MIEVEDDRRSRPATPELKKAIKLQKPANHPKYCEMISQAIGSLKERERERERERESLRGP